MGRASDPRRSRAGRADQLQRGLHLAPFRIPQGRRLEAGLPQQVRPRDGVTLDILEGRLMAVDAVDRHSQRDALPGRPPEKIDISVEVGRVVGQLPALSEFERALVASRDRAQQADRSVGQRLGHSSRERRVGAGRPVLRILAGGRRIGDELSGQVRAASPPSLIAFSSAAAAAVPRVVLLPVAPAARHRNPNRRGRRRRGAGPPPRRGPAGSTPAIASPPPRAHAARPRAGTGRPPSPLADGARRCGAPPRRARRPG